jgi:hypothetical protein
VEIEDLIEKIEDLIATLSATRQTDELKITSGGCANIEQYRTLTGRLSAFREVDIELKKLLR